LSYERSRVASLEARPLLRLLLCEASYRRHGPQPPDLRYMA